MPNALRVSRVAAGSHHAASRTTVVVPAVTREVERSVMVAPAGRVAHTSPAEYRTVRQTVQTAPATVRRSYIPPAYAHVNRTVVVRR